MAAVQRDGHFPVAIELVGGGNAQVTIVIHLARPVRVEFNPVQGIGILNVLDQQVIPGQRPASGHR